MTQTPIPQLRPLTDDEKANIAALLRYDRNRNIKNLAGVLLELAAGLVLLYGLWDMLTSPSLNGWVFALLPLAGILVFSGYRLVLWTLPMSPQLRDAEALLESRSKIRNGPWS
jgi:hypothetical protein